METKSNGRIVQTKKLTNKDYNKEHAELKIKKKSYLFSRHSCGIAALYDNITN